jgi:hypothetical protein
MIESTLILANAPHAHSRSLISKEMAGWEMPSLV